MLTLTSMLQTQIVRDLQGFIREIEAFPDDVTLWDVRPGVTNSAGNLSLHVCGNLQHFVGHALGGTGYVRQRDREFGQRSGTRADVVNELRATIAAMESVLPTVGADALAGDPPGGPGGLKLNTGQFLLHLGAHLAFHLGQAGYLRRVVTGENSSTGPLPLGPIAG